MDGEEYGVQTMERLGLSWFHWHTHGPERFAKNFIGRVTLDAKLKDYAWEGDGARAERSARLAPPQRHRAVRTSFKNHLDPAGLDRKSP
jgi:hypothetical protein